MSKLACVEPPRVYRLLGPVHGVVPPSRHAHRRRLFGPAPPPHRGGGEEAGGRGLVPQLVEPVLPAGQDRAAGGEEQRVVNAQRYIHTHTCSRGVTETKGWQKSKELQEIKE